MFWGADTQQLREHGESCRTATDRLDELRGALALAIASVEWTGADAEGFRSRFDGEVAPHWESARTALAAMTGKLDEHAEQQDAASEGSGESSDVDAGDGAGAGAGADAGEGAGGEGERRGPRDADPRRGRRPHDPADQDPGDPEFGTGGPEPYPGGLGPGRPGTSAPVPEPPEWTPPDEGSGEYDVRDPGFSDYSTYELAEMIVAGGDLTGKDPAADNMRHFLGNTGEDKPIDVDDMME